MDARLSGMLFAHISINALQIYHVLPSGKALCLSLARIQSQGLRISRIFSVCLFLPRHS